MPESYRLSIDEQVELQKRVSRDSRLLRLAQVREQAKRASAKRLQKYRERLDVTRCTVEKRLKEKWEQEKSSRVANLSKKYCKGACDVGGGHSAASVQVLKETTNRVQANRRAKHMHKKTAQRFRAAIAVVKNQTEARDKAVQDALSRRKEQLDVDRRKAHLFGEQIKEEEKNKKLREVAVSEDEAARRNCGQYSAVDFRHTRLHQLGLPTISEKHELHESEIGCNRAQEEARAEELRLHEAQREHHARAAENAVAAKHRGDVALMREKAIREREVIEQVLHEMQIRKQQQRKEALKRGELVEAPLLREWQAKKHKQDLQVAFEQVFLDTCGDDDDTFIQKDDNVSEMSMKDLYWSQGIGRRNARPPIQTAAKPGLDGTPRSPPAGTRKHSPHQPGKQIEEGSHFGQMPVDTQTGVKQDSLGDTSMRCKHSGATLPGWLSEGTSTMATDVDDDILEPRSPPRVRPIPYHMTTSSPSKALQKTSALSVVSSSEFETVSAVGRDAVDSPRPSWLDDMLAPYLDNGETLPSHEKRVGGVGDPRPDPTNEEIKETDGGQDGDEVIFQKDCAPVHKRSSGVDAGDHHASSSTAIDGSINKPRTEPFSREMDLSSTGGPTRSDQEHRGATSASPQSKRSIQSNVDRDKSSASSIEANDAMSDALSQCTNTFIEEYLKEAASMDLASKHTRSTSLAMLQTPAASSGADHASYKSLLADLDLGSLVGDQSASDDGSVTSFDIDKLLTGFDGRADGSSSVVSGLSTVVAAVQRGADQATTSDSISLAESILNPILSRSSIVRTAYGVANARSLSAPSSTVTGISALLDPIPEGSRYHAPATGVSLPTSNSMFKSSHGTEPRSIPVASSSSGESLDGLLCMLDTADCRSVTTLNNDDSGSIASTLLDSDAIISSLSSGDHGPGSFPRTPFTRSDPAVTTAPQTPISVSTEATRIESYVSSPSRSVSSIDWTRALHGPCSTTELS